MHVKKGACKVIIKIMKVLGPALATWFVTKCTCIF